MISTAIHGAGHCIVGLSFGWQVKEVSISHNDSGRVLWSSSESEMGPTSPGSVHHCSCYSVQFQRRKVVGPDGKRNGHYSWHKLQISVADRLACPCGPKLHACIFLLGIGARYNS